MKDAEHPRQIQTSGRWHTARVGLRTTLSGSHAMGRRRRRAHRVRLYAAAAGLVALASVAACSNVDESVLDTAAETPVADAGTPPQDAGPPPPDALLPGHEGGAAQSDGGTARDTGPPQDDAGSSPDGAPSHIPPGYPTRETTGCHHPGVTLTAYAGPTTISVDNTVIDAKLISESLHVVANNVTIKRSTIVFAGAYGIQVDGANCLIEDVEITVPAANLGDSGRAVSGTGFTCRRICVHDMPRGVGIWGDGTSSSPAVLIEDSYIDDLRAETSDHTTAIATWGGGNNVTIRHNTLGNGPPGGAPTGIVSAYQDFGPNGWDPPGWPNDNWKVTDNYFSGTTGGYDFTVGNSAGYAPNTNFQFGNNLFGDIYEAKGGQYGIFGAWSDQPTNYRWNNRWYTPTTTPGRSGTLIPDPDTGAPP